MKSLENFRFTIVNLMNVALINDMVTLLLIMMIIHFFLNLSYITRDIKLTLIGQARILYYSVSRPLQKQILPKYLLICLMMLCFGFTSIGKLFGQDPLKSNYHVRRGYNNLAYIVCDSRSYDLEKVDSAGLVNTIITKNVVLDSVYIEGMDVLDKHVITYSRESVVYVIYLFSRGEEVFAALANETERNKEHWPQKDSKSYKIYGRKVGNTIYIREELISTEYFRSGWVGQIIWFLILGGFFTLWIFLKRRDIKSVYRDRDDEEFTHVIMYLLIILSVVALFSALATNPRGSIGIKIYLYFFFFILASSITANIIPFVKEYLDERKQIQNS
jgi:hypothetical protein